MRGLFHRIMLIIIVQKINENSSRRDEYHCIVAADIRERTNTMEIKHGL